MKDDEFLSPEAAEDNQQFPENPVTPSPLNLSEKTATFDQFSS